MMCPFKIDQRGKLVDLSSWDRIKNKDIIVSVHGVVVGTLEHFDIGSAMIPINDRPIYRRFNI